MSLKVYKPPRLPSPLPAKMVSMKQEIDINVAALKAYDAQDYSTALRTFSEIADSSRIFFNMGMIQATVGEHKKATEMYVEATKLDQYLAVAYFQEGVSNFLLGDFEEALGNFNDALLYLRGNLCINYEQLGLKFRLYSCEVLFNRGLCYIYLSDMEQGMQDLQYAMKEKQTPEHDVIDDAIRENASGYTVFSVPVGVIFRPSEAKIKNAQKKDYLGSAKLIAATDAKDEFTGFTGAEIKKTQEPVQSPRSASTVPGSGTSFAKHEMVKTDIKSSKSIRVRAQSDASAVPRSTRAREDETRRDKLRKPVPVRAGMDSGMPKDLPLTPPSESETYSLTRARSRSQPAIGRGTMTPRSSNSSGAADYAGRSRLDTVRDEEDDERPLAEMRRTRSLASRNRPSEERPMNRSMSTRRDVRPARRTESQDLYDVYNDYYDEKPALTRSNTRRPLARAMSRSRGTSRARSRDDDEEYSNRFSDDDDGEFEMITPKRSEITKIKVKVKMDGSTKIVMIPTDIEIDDFMQRVATKFGVSTRRLKCRFVDEDGSMVDLSDADELEMLIELAKEEAKLNRQEFGRAEVTCFA